MTVFNNLANFNTNYFSNGLNNWFTPIFSCFNTQSLFNFSSNYFFNPPALFNFFNTTGGFYDSFCNTTFQPQNSNIFATGLNNTSLWDTNYNNIFNNFDYTHSNTDSFTKLTRSTGNLSLNLANKAKSYVGKVNSDAEGNRLFSNGKKQAWCADFVTYLAKETYGSNLPSSFGSSAVSGLRNWGKKNNCYLEMPSSNKADFIAQNVKVGDIMIEKDGKSHTGIVTKVNSDGSFEVVEGNSGNKVAARKYNADSSTLSGFVTLDKFA